MTWLGSIWTGYGASVSSGAPGKHAHPVVVGFMVVRRVAPGRTRGLERPAASASSRAPRSRRPRRRDRPGCWRAILLVDAKTRRGGGESGRTKFPSEPWRRISIE